MSTRRPVTSISESIFKEHFLMLLLNLTVMLRCDSSTEFFTKANLFKSSWLRKVEVRGFPISHCLSVCITLPAIKILRMVLYLPIRNLKHCMHGVNIFCKVWQHLYHSKYPICSVHFFHSPNSWNPLIPLWFLHIPFSRVSVWHLFLSSIPFLHVCSWIDSSLFGPE